MAPLASAGKGRFVWLLRSVFSRKPAVDEITGPVPLACWLPTNPCWSR
ncbi:MAG: hypothetical protein VX644_01705 [Planctomycetota bacterium]|nr:hypothetical protein [Planctomycetota bacterium]